MLDGYWYGAQQDNDYKPKPKPSVSTEPVWRAAESDALEAHRFALISLPLIFGFKSTHDLEGKETLIRFQYVEFQSMTEPLA